MENEGIREIKRKDDGMMDLKKDDYLDHCFR